MVENVLENHSLVLDQIQTAGIAASCGIVRNNLMRIAMTDSIIWPTGQAPRCYQLLVQSNFVNSTFSSKCLREIV